MTNTQHQRYRRAPKAPDTVPVSTTIVPCTHSVNVCKRNTALYNCDTATQNHEQRQRVLMRRMSNGKQNERLKSSILKERCKPMYQTEMGRYAMLKKLSFAHHYRATPTRNRVRNAQISTKTPEPLCHTPSRSQHRGFFWWRDDTQVLSNYSPNRTRSFSLQHIWVRRGWWGYGG